MPLVTVRIPTDGSVPPCLICGAIVVNLAGEAGQCWHERHERKCEHCWVPEENAKHRGCLGDRTEHEIWRPVNEVVRPTVELLAGRGQPGQYIAYAALAGGRHAWIMPLFDGAARLGLDAEPISDAFETVWDYLRWRQATRALALWNYPEEKDPSGWYRCPMDGRRRPDGDSEREYTE